MHFTVRQLTYPDYDNILIGWWKDWKTVIPGRDYLPDNATGGYIVYDGETPVCAGFVYNTNSSIAWCEFIVTNFNYKDKEKRRQCLMLLGSTISDVAKGAGKGYLMTVLKNKLLIQICENQGYMNMGEGYTNMIKIL